MLLKKIKLKNFRNFGEKDMILNPFLTIIIGQNSRGKTNLLEAIYFIINGIGFREKKEDELIFFGKDKAFVEGIFNIAEEAMDFQINIKKSNELVEKIYSVNRAKKNHKDYLKEQTHAILFSPEQINVVTGAPNLRRDYFNKLLIYYDPEYKKRLTNYEVSLRKRNRVLEFHDNVEKLKEELVFWDEYLEEQAEYITKKRQEYVDYLNQNRHINSKEFEIEYLKNTLTQARLSEVFEQERRWRQTIVGPQKDDFKILLKDSGFKKDIQLFGSRSEQRLGIFWLKMSEVKYFEEKYKKKPIILLDDIFSEFDLENRKLIFDMVKKYQVIITTTEPELLDLVEMPKSIVTLH